MIGFADGIDVDEFVLASAGSAPAIEPERVRHGGFAVGDEVFYKPLRLIGKIESLGFTVKADFGHARVWTLPNDEWIVPATEENRQIAKQEALGSSTKEPAIVDKRQRSALATGFAIPGTAALATGFVIPGTAVIPGPALSANDQTCEPIREPERSANTYGEGNPPKALEMWVMLDGFHNRGAY
jgi:hypothetical protein